MLAFPPGFLSLYLRVKTSERQIWSERERSRIKGKREEKERIKVSRDMACWFKCFMSFHKCCLSQHLQAVCSIETCGVCSLIYLLREQLLWFWSCFAYAFIRCEETKRDFSASSDCEILLHEAKSLAVPSFIRFSSLIFSSTSYPCVCAFGYFVVVLVVFEQQNACNANLTQGKWWGFNVKWSLTGYLPGEVKDKNKNKQVSNKHWITSWSDVPITGM